MGARVFDDNRPTVDLGPGALDKAMSSPPPEDGGEDDDRDLTEANREDETRSLGGMVQDAARAVDPVHALPTQQLPKRTGAQSVTRLSESKTTSSPVEAMRLDEVERTRVFLKVAFTMCVLGAVMALVTGGDVVAQRVVVIGSVLGAFGAGWILMIARDDDGYRQDRVIVPGTLIVAGAMSGVYYWGIASPVAGMLVYGIYFFSLGSSRTVTLGMYLLVATIHLLLGIGVITDLLHDRGIISLEGVVLRDQLAVLLIIEFLYLIAFITARKSQRVTLDAMNKLEQAVRGVAQREALLAEARAELDRALKIGGPGRFTDQVVGAFRLGILIGRGGMGEVYEAHGVSDKREAAVKLLHPGTLADPTSVQRFIREAQTAAKLDCPYVVRVLEVGTTQGEVPFLAMERLRGHDLAHTLRRKRRIDLVAARTVCEHVSIGLDAARKAGIVHRDLKPHNIFLGEDGATRRYKILDFGVSKSGGSGTLTQGHVVGTPAYMAPEQARGEDVDHRADVYSLAAILYRSITGNPAFTGKDVPSTLYEVVYRVPTQPSVLATLPTDVDRVLAIGLAKSRDDRFETAVELAEWFGLAIESRLSPEQRRRADALIEKHPWGSRPGAR